MKVNEILLEGPRGVPDYARRRARLRALLLERGLDVAAITLPANRFYLSGFELSDPQPNESVGLLIVSVDGDDWLATDSRYKLAAREIWPEERTLIYGTNKFDAVAEILAGVGAIVGVETKTLSLDAFRRLREAAKGRFALVAADGLVESLRVVKDDWEIAALKASFRLNHAMMKWLEKDLVKIRERGLSEIELSWEIEKFFRDNGAQGLAFATITAFGKNGAKPHAEPGAAKAPSEGPLLVDAGCRAFNYCSDQTRAWWLGVNPSREFTETMRLVREAQAKAIATIRPGVDCAHVYRVARNVFEDAGVASYFTHGLGHGVGLETHEAPTLSPATDKKLRAGMVVTVEPGLYYDSWGGARWENTALVTADGAEIL